MRLRGPLIVSAAVACVAAAAVPAAGQYQAPSEKLLMTAHSAATWSEPGGAGGAGEGNVDVVQLQGPVRIELDRATLTARQAVVWIMPDPAARAGTQRVRVALIGDARVEQAGATRSGERMVVTADVAGRIRLTADERVEQAPDQSPLYQAALSMIATSAGPSPAAPGATTPAAAPPTTRAVAASRPADARPAQAAEALPSGVTPARGIAPQTPSMTGPASRGAAPAAGAATLAAGADAPAVGPGAPVLFRAPQLEVVDTPEGLAAVVLSGGVTLVQHRPNGDLIELQARRVVVFTALRSLKELQQSDRFKQIGDAVTAAYLEGDVRVRFTPSEKPGKPSVEQRLDANRVYYEFASDRAILTDAVVHTLEPGANVPVILRAKTVRHLAQGEYNASGVQLSTSAFAVPSIAIGADKIYVRQDEGDEGEPTRMTFRAVDATFRTFGIPFFYLPYAGGSVTGEQSALRSIGFEHTQQFGFGALSEWGLFETFGAPPPRDLDAAYRLDYYTDRGPAGGVNARYQGGLITEMTRQPWTFEGNLESYFVYDHGFDDVGRPIPPAMEDRFRGHILYEHQHFFPDGWQLQLRGGYVSDQNFLEQWFPRNFDQRLPHDVSAYLKRQRETEAFTLLAQFQPNDLVTTADLLQEQFEVEHLPEIGYHRVGDSLLDGAATFYSDNTVSGLHYQPTRESLIEQGFVPGLSPGLPSLGTTGTTDNTVWRADFRQQIDFPINAGRFKIVPYVVGRYTFYSDSPSGGTKNRFFAGAGTRVSTSFWKTDDSVQSELFDLHRMRHVIEPELNVFASAQSQDRSDVFIYDEQIDPISDLSAAQIALRQRWQTYRGGPGRWRSVDFFTLNVEANFFSNEPTHAQLDPLGFRGLYFSSLPETSIARDSLNFDAAWRISDNSVVLADASENIDGRARLATASVGLVTRRDERLIYYVGNRYIADLNSNITTAAVEYQLSRKYTLGFAQSFDFGLGENVSSEVSVVRRFDTFLVVVRAARNETTGQSEVSFNILPVGFGGGLDSRALSQSLVERRR